MKTNKKVAIVTGANRGIGKAIALKLANQGFNIAVVDIVDDFNGSDYEGIDVTAFYIKADISNADDRQNVLHSCIKKFGRVDVLVNNAGVGPRVRKDILETTEDSWDFVININLKGTFFLTQLVANNMIENIQKDKISAPKIINIASMSSYVSSTSRGEYCISKAGISMMTALFADKLAEYGAYVYEIRPGIIQTDMTSGVKAKYDKLIAEGITPIKRWGYPTDIANAVSAICDDKFLFSTGEVFNVDGGYHIQRM